MNNHSNPIFGSLFLSISFISDVLSHVTSSQVLTFISITTGILASINYIQQIYSRYKTNKILKERN